MILAPLSQIVANPWQPRQSEDKDHIVNLAASIREHRYLDKDKRGLLQIPIARMVDRKGHTSDGPQAQRDLETFLAPHCPPVLRTLMFFQLAFGHSRLAAFKLLQKQYPSEEWDEMPLEVVFYGDLQMAKTVWAENAQRKDLNGVEEAFAIQKMIADFRWTQEQAAEHLSLNRSTVTNKLRLLKLPQEVLSKVGQGNMTERQAIALLPLYDLPAETIAASDVSHSHWEYVQPSAIVKGADKMSSDKLRERVAEAVVRATAALEGNASFPLDQLIEGEGILPHPCIGCVHNVKTNKKSRCVLPTCFEAKTTHWRAREEARAQTAFNIPIADPDSDYLNITQFYPYQGGAATVAYAREAQCTNLRLQYKGHGLDIDPENHPNIAIICAHGVRKSCQCAKALEAQAKAAEEERLRADKERFERDLVEPARALIVTALQDNVKVWQQIGHLLNVEGVRKAKTVEEVQQLIARSLMMRGIWHNPYTNYEASMKAVNENLSRMGLPPVGETVQPPAEQHVAAD